MKEALQMENFIKNYNLNGVRKKLIIIYILNVIDIVFTIALIKSGWFAEANGFMQSLVQSAVMSYVVKITIPATILFYIYMRVKNSDKKTLKMTNIGLLIPLIMYIGVDVLHVMYTIAIPIFDYLY